MGQVWLEARERDPKLMCNVDTTNITFTEQLVFPLHCMYWHGFKMLVLRHVLQKKTKNAVPEQEKQRWKQIGQMNQGEWTMPGLAPHTHTHLKHGKGGTCDNRNGGKSRRLIRLSVYKGQLWMDLPGLCKCLDFSFLRFMSDNRTTQVQTGQLTS